MYVMHENQLLWADKKNENEKKYFQSPKVLVLGEVKYHESGKKWFKLFLTPKRV